MTSPFLFKAYYNFYISRYEKDIVICFIVACGILCIITCYYDYIQLIIGVQTMIIENDQYLGLGCALLG